MANEFKMDVMSMVSNLHSDRPITQESKDEFNRMGFVETLYKEIKSISPEESIVIGLSGAWGSGKTSVVNLLCSKLKPKKEGNSLKPNDTIIVRFNPWNQINGKRISEEYFVNSFFNAIKRQLWEDKDDRYIQSDNLKELFDAINDYSDLLKPGFLKVTIKASSNHLSKYLQAQMNTIEDAKQRVKKALGNFGIKILIVIDDIDRLPKEQIRLVFQLVTTIADFESVNYLISYDRKVVEDAVKEIQGINAGDYLEKVINVPINMPNPSTASMNSLIDKRLNYIPNKYYLNTKDMEDASYRFSQLLPLLQRTTSTVRKLNRLCNSMQFKLPLLSKRIDALDLLAIEHLRIISEDLLHFAVRNSTLLCVGYDPNAQINPIDSAKWADLKAQLSVGLNSNASRDDILKIIDLLFNQSREELHDAGAKCRIAHVQKRLIDPSTFEYYLTSDANVSTYTSDILQNAVSELDTDNLSLLFEQSILENGYMKAVEALASLDQGVDSEKAKKILYALTRNIEFADRSGITFSENTRTIDVIESFIEIINEAERDEFIANLFESLDAIHIAFLAEFIIRRDRTYSRNRFEGQRYKALISEECVEGLEQSFVSAMKSLDEDNQLAKIPYFYPQLTLWRNAAQESYRLSLQSISYDPLKLILFSESFVGAWRELGTGIPSSFHTNSEILEYASYEDLLDAAETLDIPSTFHLLSYDTKQKTAALIIAATRCIEGASISEEVEGEEVNRWLEENASYNNPFDETFSEENDENNQEDEKIN